MKKLIYFFFVIIIFLFTSCGKTFIDETNEDDTNKETLPFKIIPRDTVKEDFELYPD